MKRGGTSTTMLIMMLDPGSCDYDVGKSGSANVGQTEERGWHIFDQVVITENGINISTLAWIILVGQ